MKLSNPIFLSLALTLWVCTANYAYGQESSLERETQSHDGASTPGESAQSSSWRKAQKNMKSAIVGATGKKAYTAAKRVGTGTRALVRGAGCVAGVAGAAAVCISAGVLDPGLARPVGDHMHRAVYGVHKD